MTESSVVRSATTVVWSSRLVLKGAATSGASGPVIVASAADQCRRIAAVVVWASRLALKFVESNRMRPS